jgi:N-acyl-L-homoserine lactone synthetase
MNIDVLTEEITAAGREFTIEVVNTPTQLREAFQLRYQVYCVERGYEPGDEDEETDEFDAQSRHILLRRTSDGQVVGTVRLICPNTSNLSDSFPIQRLCETSLLAHVPLLTTGEISRFAISKERRGGRAELVLLRLTILRGIVQLSWDLGLTTWLAVMERSLMRLHRTNEIHFQPIGPLVSYHGMRQPTIGVIQPVLDWVRQEQFPTWDFLTDGGRWFGRDIHR